MTNDFKLDDIPDLTVLTELDLTNKPSLKHVDALSKCAALQTLNLSRCSALENLDGLANCAALTELDLRHCEKVNLSGSSGLKNLKTLLIGSASTYWEDGMDTWMGNSILTEETLAVLETLTGLEWLDLHNGGVWEDEIPAVLRERTGLSFGAYKRPTCEEDFSAWTE